MTKKTAPCGVGEICPGRADFNLNDSYGVKTQRPKLLLHSCCGPCSTAVIERLISDYAITVFFFNPNITDRDEYEKRLAAQKQVIEYFNGGNAVLIDRIELIEGEYNTDGFYRAVCGLENEPEGGSRCVKCFEHRLAATADMAKQLGFEVFGTTLTISPHKNYPMISSIGNTISQRTGVPFLDLDMKKRGGFMRSIVLSKEIGIYRQNYCGCEFSKWFDKKI